MSGAPSLVQVQADPGPRAGPDADLCWLPAVEVARLVRRRVVSPLEVVDAHLAEIVRRNPSLNAYVILLADEARDAAHRAERAVMAGAPLGPLHGVPVALKDLFDFKAGVRNTFGSRPLADFVSTTTSTCVQRLERAGAIVLGKTNSAEFGHKATTDNPLFGPTSTPFCLGKNAGGSSGGSAAAVAAGLASLALGSDGAGSVRIPAALCGAFGLKPSYGRVASAARPNAFRSHTPFAQNGPLARSVADAALMLQVLAGPDPRDPLSLPHEDQDYLAATRRPIRGLRVAYSPDLGIFPVDPVVAAVVAEALGAFVEAGAHVEPVRVRIERHQSELSGVLLRQVGLMLADVFEGFKARGLDLLGAHRSELSLELVGLVELGQNVSGLEARRDDTLRTEVLDAIQDVFVHHDVLVTPTLGVPAVDNAGQGQTVGPREVNGQTVEPLLGWCLTYPFNFTGHPAASVPAGVTADGLPIGLQIVGRRFDDAGVLAASAAFERARPWQHRYRR